MAATPAAKAALSNILSIKLEANPEQIANAVLKFWHDKPETSIIVNTSGKVQAEFLYQIFFHIFDSTATSKRGKNFIYKENQSHFTLITNSLL